jgi:hypothetical protein
MMNEKYMAEIDIECQWKTNEKLSSYDPKIHWNPSLYVENLLTETKQTIDYKISDNTDDPESKIVTEYRKIKGVMD